MKARGFSLLELVVAMALLGALTIALFEAFDYGATSFRRAAAKQDSQSAIRAVYVGLRDDLRRSHFSTITVSDRAAMIDGQEISRDAICLGSLKDWSSDDSFDEVNGLPMWDRYHLYYGTNEGRLIRSNIDPDRPDYSPAPFADLDPEVYFQENPSLNRGYQSSHKILSKNLFEFSCQLSASRNTVDVRCLLLSGKKKKNQISFTVFPQNTWPKGENR